MAHSSCKDVPVPLQVDWFIPIIDYGSSWQGPWMARGSKATARCDRQPAIRLSVLHLEPGSHLSAPYQFTRKHGAQLNGQRGQGILPRSNRRACFCPRKFNAGRVLLLCSHAHFQLPICSRHQASERAFHEVVKIFSADFQEQNQNKPKVTVRLLGYTPGRVYDRLLNACRPVFLAIMMMVPHP